MLAQLRQKSPKAGIVRGPLKAQKTATPRSLVAGLSFGRAALGQRCWATPLRDGFAFEHSGF